MFATHFRMNKILFFSTLVVLGGCGGLQQADRVDEPSKERAWQDASTENDRPGDEQNDTPTSNDGYPTAEEKNSISKVSP